MHKKIHIEDRNVDLIFDLEFDYLQLRALDYMHYVRQARLAKEEGQEDQYKMFMRNVLNTRGVYKTYIPLATENLLTSFQQSFPGLIPEVAITPRTSRKYLQNPTLKAFQSRFPDMLHFEEPEIEIPFGQNRQNTLNKGELFLIIDDVYAEGKTANRIISRLEKNKLFIIACPLYIPKRTI